MIKARSNEQDSKRGGDRRRRDGREHSVQSGGARRVGCGSSGARHARLRLDGAVSGAIRMHYSTEVNARLAWESLHVFRNWRDTIGGDGDPGFVETGYMVIAPDREADGFRHNIAMQREVALIPASSVGRKGANWRRTSI